LVRARARECGIGHERESIRFWTQVADEAGAGDRQPGRAQLTPVGVLAPAPVVQRLHAGQADRNVDLPVAPGAPERVADQHGRAHARQLAQARADRARGRVGVARQQHHRVRRGRVRRVDAGVRAHQPAPGAADQHAALGAQDLVGLVEHDLHGPRIARLPVGPRLCG
jgi:hypothetical protein